MIYYDYPGFYYPMAGLGRRTVPDCWKPIELTSRMSDPEDFHLMPTPQIPNWKSAYTPVVYGVNTACPFCYTNYEGNAKFCTRCGKPRKVISTDEDLTDYLIGIVKSSGLEKYLDAHSYSGELIEELNNSQSEGRRTKDILKGTILVPLAYKSEDWEFFHGRVDGVDERESSLGEMAHAFILYMPASSEILWFHPYRGVKKDGSMHLLCTPYYMETNEKTESIYMAASGGLHTDGKEYWELAVIDIHKGASFADRLDAIRHQRIHLPGGYGDMVTYWLAHQVAYGML